MLDTLQYIAHETDCWLEITTLLIPGLNDSTRRDRGDDAAGSPSTLGPDVPLHFTAFHPDYKMTDTPATPPATLRARAAIALASGLRHVYTGNVHDTDGGTTFCPGCHAPLIVRDWYALLRYELDAPAAARIARTAARRTLRPGTRALRAAAHPGQGGDGLTATALKRYAARVRCSSCTE